jgi:chromosome segregation ATPase
LIDLFISDLLKMSDRANDSHWLDNVLMQMEQSKISYDVQREEFHQLNDSLQVYLTDMKSIEDDNRYLHEKIGKLRSNHLVSLEEHLKRLPNDFRQESDILNRAHVERYRSKSRARRYINEREELKKRIHFLVNQDKLDRKQMNRLRKQEHSMSNEIKQLHEEIERVRHHVDNEKQNYQQSMNVFDRLQREFEHVCVERSKAEVIESIRS